MGIVNGHTAFYRLPLPKPKNIVVRTFFELFEASVPYMDPDMYSSSSFELGIILFAFS